MNSENYKDFVKTTVYIPKDLHLQAKMMALLTHTNISYLVRVSLSEKIKQLKETQKG